MPPFGFGKKEEQPQSFTTDITDKEDLEEIKEIAEMLNPNEEVLVVARQSRLKPGGSKLTPNVVFATDRRIIIKDPIADELTKLANLKEKGIISEDEFRQMKQDLIKKKI